MNSSYTVNKNQKMSEFSKIKLKNHITSDLLIPIIASKGNNSYVNATMDIQDIIKYAYSYSLNSLYQQINDYDLWEEYEGEPEPKPVIYDLNVENPYDPSLQDI